MTRRSIVIAATVLFTSVLATVAMAADPFVGTWKLNVAKSNSPINQSSTIIVKPQENGLSCVNDSVDSNGKATHVEWTAKYDGKDYPVKGNPDVDSISLTKIDANTAHFVQKKNGKSVMSGESVVSKDGKTWTLGGKGRTTSGQGITFKAVFDKQ